MGNCGGQQAPIRAKALKSRHPCCLATTSDAKKKNEVIFLFFIIFYFYFFGAFSRVVLPTVVRPVFCKRIVAGGLRPLRDQLRVKAVYLLPFF